MKRLRIIINGYAGSGGRARAAALIQSARRQLWGWDADFELPATLDETRELCRTASAGRYEAIVVCGGDGTFNQALPALVSHELPVAVYPLGTANDLAAELGIRPDWTQLQSLLDRRQYKEIDLVRINDRYFATVGGLGLGAALTSRVNELRQHSETFASIWSQMKSEMYGLMVGQMILTGQSPMRRLMITADGFVKDLEVSSLLIANQSRLGGDILVAPKAQNDDGLFDVVVLALGNRFELMRSMLGAKLGQSFPGNHRFSARRCQVEAIDGKPIGVFGDGELLFEAARLDFELVPRCLKVLCAHQPAHPHAVSERYAL